MDSDIQQAIDELKNQILNFGTQADLLQSRLTLLEQFNVPTVINPISQHNLRNTMTVTASMLLKQADAQTAANYTHFFIADRTYQITDVIECHSVNSTSGTLAVYKTAPGGVDTPLMSDLTTGTSATVPQFATLVTNNVTDVLTLRRGDRLRCGTAGNLANLTDQLIMVFLRPV